MDQHSQRPNLPHLWNFPERPGSIEQSNTPFLTVSSVTSILLRSPIFCPNFCKPAKPHALRQTPTYYSVVSRNYFWEICRQLQIWCIFLKENTRQQKKSWRCVALGAHPWDHNHGPRGHFHKSCNQRTTNQSTQICKPTMRLAPRLNRTHHQRTPDSVIPPLIGFPHYVDRVDSKNRNR